MKRILYVLPLIDFFWILQLSCSSSSGYKIEKVLKLGLTKSDDNFDQSIIEAKKFSEKLVTEYLTFLSNKVHPKFKNSFNLWQSDKKAVKIVLSTFNESLIQVFPSNKNQLIVDAINFPIQTALCFGYIDLNAPQKEIDLKRIELKVPFNQALKDYHNEPGRINLIESGVGLFSTVDLIFENERKLFQFKEKTMVALLGSLTIINNTALFKKLHGHGDSLKFHLNSPLILVSENRFSWALEATKELGNEVAEVQIKELYINSDFFKQSLIYPKLEPKVREILQKKSHSEKGTFYKYPLWEFKKDIDELKREAKQVGLSDNDVDELLNYTPLQPKDGTLFLYYRNHYEFTLQWIIVNSVLFFSALLLKRIKDKISALELIFSTISEFIGKAFIPVFSLTINVWIFNKCPDSLEFYFWIIPGLIFLVTFIVSLRTDKKGLI